MSGLLIASVPILVAVLSRLTGGGRPAHARCAGRACWWAWPGSALLIGPGTPSGDLGSVGEVLLVALCYATGPLIASRKLAELPPLAMTAVCLAFAAVVYAPLAALTWPSTVPSGKVLAALAGLAVICTAAGVRDLLPLIAEVGPARASVITYINPAIAVARRCLAARRAAHAGHGGARSR